MTATGSGQRGLAALGETSSAERCAVRTRLAATRPVVASLGQQPNTQKQGGRGRARRRSSGAGGGRTQETRETRERTEREVCVMRRRLGLGLTRDWGGGAGVYVRLDVAHGGGSWAGL
jgi:hypothetical protein